MSGQKRLKRAFEHLNFAKKDREDFIPGILGLEFEGKKTVRVQNRDGYVWVRLRRNLSEVVQAYNDAVSPVHDLPVLIVRDEIDPTRYRVVARDLGAYKDWGRSAYLPVHGNQHSFNRATGGGGDIVWVFGRQMMPLLAYPSGTAGANVVFVNEFTYYQGTSFTYAPTQLSPDLLALKPSGTQGAVMALLYLDSATTPTLLAGNFFDASLTGTADVIPYLPSVPDAYGIPVAGIRMVTGTTSILWDNIYDVRPWLIGDGFIPTGTVAGHTIQDEGVNLPYRTNINFTGDIVWAIDNAGSNRTDVIISGSGAGFTQEIFDNGGSEGSDLDIDFALGLDVSVTGSVRAEVNAHVFEEDDKGLVRKKSYGGNARGDHAVDLQTSRALSSHVASGAKSVVGGGENNAVSGAQSVVAGGSGNSISTAYSVIAGGRSNNIATSEHGTIPGGRENDVTAQYAQASGYYAQATHYGVDARASGRYSADGDVQRMEFLLFEYTTDDTPTELFLGNVTSERMGLSANAAWGFDIMLVVTDGEECEYFTGNGLIVHDGGSVTLVGSTVSNPHGTGTLDADLEIKANTGNDSLYLGVSGTNNTDLLWNARVIVVQSTFPLS